MSGGSDDCELLPWDSAHFGVAIARARALRLTTETMTRIDAWCRDERVECLYFSCDPGDRESVRLAERGGFRLVDVRTTFRRPPTAAELPASGVCRLATLADADWVAGLARTSFGDTRFYFDGGFELERCHGLYEIWARKAMADESQTVWLALDGDARAGFVTCQLDPATRAGSIGLIAVAPEHRGRRVGEHLVGRAVAHFRAAAAMSVQVVTQARNLRALRLYERCGFLVEDLRLTYHKWYVHREANR